MSTYQGWTNYETWNVALWLDNDQWSHEWARDLAQGIWEHADDTKHPHWTTSQHARFDMADALKEHFEDSRPDLGCTVWSDLLSAALAEVEWVEIAEHYLSDIDGYESEAA